VSYTINCYVKLAFNLSQGTDIENIIKGISAGSSGIGQLKKNFGLISKLSTMACNEEAINYA
ncbi:7122_t:CDS:2, partial [Gigaspora rosea]